MSFGLDLFWHFHDFFAPDGRIRPNIIISFKQILLQYSHKQGALVYQFRNEDPLLHLSLPQVQECNFSNQWNKSTVQKKLKIPNSTLKAITLYRYTRNFMPIKTGLINLPFTTTQTYSAIKFLQPKKQGHCKGDGTQVW